MGTYLLQNLMYLTIAYNSFEYNKNNMAQKANIKPAV